MTNSPASLSIHKNSRLNINKSNLIVLGILALFLLLEIIIYFYHSYPLTRRETDGIGYMLRAQGAVFQPHSYHGPGYPVAIKMLMFSGLNAFSSAKIVSILFGLIFVWVSWKILSQFSDRREAILGTFLVAFNQHVLLASNYIMSDMMAASLALSSVAFLVLKQENRWGYFLAGILGACAYLTRHVYIVISVFPLLICFISYQRGSSFLRSVKFLMFFYVGFLVVALPWWIHLYILKGNPFWSRHHLNLAFAMYNMNEAKLSWTRFPSINEFENLFDVIRSAPALFIKNWLNNLKDVPLRILLLFHSFGILGALGSFFWLRKLSVEKFKFLIFCLIYAGFMSLGWFDFRYYLILVVLSASFLTTALFNIPQITTTSDSLNRLYRALQKISLKKVMIFIAIIMIPLNSLVKTSEYLLYIAHEYVAAANILKKNQSEPMSIMVAKPHIPYYLGAKYLEYKAYNLQDATIEDLPKILERAKPDYFIYDHRYAKVEFPQFSIFLHPKRNPFPEILQFEFLVNVPLRIVVYKYKK